MSKRVETSRVIDEVIRYSAAGAVISAGIVAPGLLLVLAKPLSTLLDTLDTRAHEREVKRLIYYLKDRNYLYGDYDHGLQLTKAGKSRLQRIELDGLAITPQHIWDKRWRIVLYDIPESHRRNRANVSAYLKRLGMFQLQKSVWIHPFPCREAVESIAAHWRVDQFMTYFDATNLANEKVLIAHMKDRYPSTCF